MKKFGALAACAALMMLTACSHSDGIGMDYNANPDKTVPESQAFKTLTVTWPSAFEPYSGGVAVAVDDQKNLKVTSLEAGTGKELCSATKQLTDDVVAQINEKVTAASLATYQPPAPDDASCNIPGQVGIQVAYVGLDGAENSFDTGTCELPTPLLALTVILTDEAAALADQCDPAGTAEQQPAEQPAEEQPAEEKPAEEAPAA